MTATLSIVALVLMAGVSGCASRAPAAPGASMPSTLSTTATTGDTGASLDRETLHRIDVLLSAADVALGENQLTTPPGDNALDYYRGVLELDPGNAEALDGINSIVEHYIEWALDSADYGSVRRAREYLTLAAGIDPSHPNIGPVSNRINDLEDSRTTVFRLDSSEVRSRTVSGSEFNRIARRIGEANAFVEIRAPNDESGRWIYQQLNDRVDRRITARFVLSDEPSVAVDI